MSEHILSSINIFSDLSDNELENLQKVFKPRNYLKNSMIILEEEYGDLVFVVKTGTIKITRVNDEGKEVILALLGPGEIFGELAILDGEARSANALAQENCQLLAINKEDFLDILKHNFSISYSLMCELAKRLRKSDQQIEALSLSDAEHRIGVSLLNLAEDMGVIRKGKVTIQNLPFQQDIANMAGTSRETVSRVMKILENKDMISKEGHTLVIPDYSFFKQIFGKTF
jgi:CRP-like cAMP-binding protein